jgi:hypothetical protein
MDLEALAALNLVMDQEAPAEANSTEGPVVIILAMVREGQTTRSSIALRRLAAMNT